MWCELYFQDSFQFSFQNKDRYRILIVEVKEGAEREAWGAGRRKIWNPIYNYLFLLVWLLVSSLSQILSTSTGPRHPEHKVGPKQNIFCVQEATKNSLCKSCKGHLVRHKVNRHMMKGWWWLCRWKGQRERSKFIAIKIQLQRLVSSYINQLLACLVLEFLPNPCGCSSLLELA